VPTDVAPVKPIGNGNALATGLAVRACALAASVPATLPGGAVPPIALVTLPAAVVCGRVGCASIGDGRGAAVAVDMADIADGAGAGGTDMEAAGVAADMAGGGVLFCIVATAGATLGDAAPLHAASRTAPALPAALRSNPRRERQAVFTDMVMSPSTARSHRYDILVRSIRYCLPHLHTCDDRRTPPRPAAHLLRGVCRRSRSPPS